MRDPSILNDQIIRYAYIQIPFCPSRCAYCHWSRSYDDAILSIREFKEPFVTALKKEIQRRSLFAREREKVDLQYLHFGGGTPSMLSAEDLQDLLSSVLQAYGKKIEGMKKVAIEVRPDSLNPRKIRDLRAMGFNRISLGVQTFNQSVLARLQRSVNVEHCLACYEWIRTAGFEDVSVDMLYGLPYQSFDDVKRDIDILLKLKPDHIDAYPWEPRYTAFADRMDLFGEGEKRKKISWAVYIKKTLEEHGYDNYCHVCFARPGKQNIMQLVSANYLLPYLGFGPGAEYIFDTHVVKTRRILRKYIEYQMTATRFQYPEVTPHVSERVNAITRHLLLKEGIDINTFNQRYRMDLEQFLLSYKDTACLKREMEKQACQDQDAFILWVACLKKLNRFQKWLEAGILEKNNNTLRINDEYRLSSETWTDLYYDV